MEPQSHAESLRIIWSGCITVWSVMSFVGLIMYLRDKSAGNLWQRFKEAIPGGFMLTGLILWIGSLASLSELSTVYTEENPEGEVSGFGIFVGMFIMPFVVYWLLRPFYIALNLLIHFDMEDKHVQAQLKARERRHRRSMPHREMIEDPDLAKLQAGENLYLHAGMSTQALRLAREQVFDAACIAASTPGKAARREAEEHEATLRWIDGEIAKRSARKVRVEKDIAAGEHYSCESALNPEGCEVGDIRQCPCGKYYTFFGYKEHVGFTGYRYTEAKWRRKRFGTKKLQQVTV